MRSAASICSLVVAFAAGVAQADVYRWVDASGGVHYGDVPVEGAVMIKTTSPRMPSANNASAVNRSSSSRDQAAAINEEMRERRERDAAARGVKDDLAKTQSDQCKRATQRYQTSINSHRMYKEGKDGQRTYLTDAELDTERLQARTDRDAYCSGSSASGNSATDSKSSGGVTASSNKH